MFNILSYWCYLYKKLFFSQRTLVFYLLLFLFIDMMMAPILSFSKEVHIPITPWGFPLWLCNNYYLMLFVLLYIFWIAEFPIFERNQMFIILRIGKIKWMFGQILYLFSTGFIFVFSITALGNLYLISSLTFENGWGKIWGTLSNLELCSERGILMSIRYEIISLYNPIELNILMLFLGGLIMGMLGILLLALNRYSKIIGVSFISFLAFLNLAARYFEAKWLILSPVNWMQITFYKRTLYPDKLSFTTVLLMIFVILLVTIIFTLFKTKKLEFERLK